MKKKISTFKLDFLEKELEYQKEMHVINEETKNQILNQYEQPDEINFIKVVITVGATLVGLSALSFVTAQWEFMTNPIKLSILFVLFLASLVLYLYLKKHNPKTSYSFLYINGFLIGGILSLAYNIVDLPYHQSVGLFAWSLILILLSILFKDKLMFIFAQVVAIFFAVSGLDQVYLILPTILIPIFYLTNIYHKYPLTSSIINVGVICALVLQYFVYLETNSALIIISYMLIGFYLFYRRFKYHNLWSEYIGFILASTMAVLMTSREAWENLLGIEDGNTYAIVWGTVLAIYFLVMIKHKSMTSLFFLCVLIFRFYFDMFYGLMPRSIFFFVGGVVILMMGLYFERKRRLET
ncbi:Uncharacterized membrane protein [Dethiosulfatibacter aminovorans DSM 17477]|uniref:Uncharacterized membrane protein n=1 Tax=Dethiosulfatibacter aminovorans DSM 17477 TaxID=1121476 RepID=A0A1M6L869_9FIRM|nr:DUF2157 domain-containing protein [Dethiosulfatibacter aminovorans]SHJ67392.1 Uncharacterized membrane protein [Dethiosulfatibacter aminovorans DSM 17477]